MENTEVDFTILFCKMLISLRLNCGFTQKQLAEALGLTRSSVSYYESGKTCPDMLSLRKLADIFGIGVEQFYHPENYTAPPINNKRVRKKKVVCINPKRIGELTQDERQLIAEYRLHGKESCYEHLNRNRNKHEKEHC